MKKKLTMLLAFVSVTCALYAQTNFKAPVDSALMQKGIFGAMPESVNVMQTLAVWGTVKGRIADNELSEYDGYRVRIYFDNSQDAREASSAILSRFEEAHPDIPAYRTFDSPNFKVTVGDYRTRSEALATLRTIQPEYPSAFIVREKFKYPSLPGDYVSGADSLKVQPVL